MYQACTSFRENRLSDSFTLFMANLSSQNPYLFTDLDKIRYRQSPSYVLSNYEFRENRCK